MALRTTVGRPERCELPLRDAVLNSADNEAVAAFKMKKVAIRSARRITLGNFSEWILENGTAVNTTVGMRIYFRGTNSGIVGIAFRANVPMRY